MTGRVFTGGTHIEDQGRSLRAHPLGEFCGCDLGRATGFRCISATDSAKQDRTEESRDQANRAIASHETSLHFPNAPPIRRES